MNWYRQWDGTVNSLNQESKRGRARIMTQQEVKDYILEFVKSMNNKRVYVDYQMVQTHIKFVLKREVPIRTIRRYGKESGIKWKKTRGITLRDADKIFWYNIGQFRSSLQRIANDRLIFIDETAVYFIMIPRKTLVASGQQPLILVTQPSVYAKRYDFIGAINGSQSNACRTLTSEDRNYRRIKGVRQAVINQWITDTLASAINRLHIDNIYLICDQTRAHNEVDMIEVLRAGKCESVKEILHMPTASAKYVSPLDNLLWHSFKKVIRNRHPLSTTDIPPLLLSESFYSLSKQEIENAYRKCGLVYGTDEHYDRP
ncbi:unnamed protein product [Rotaria sp. Silwood2]|nr:unnamed protein product [Rotaria sp. Silwood2]CAF3049991.1 unnamed protein product [Rotaria sp. Silwood2]CAF3279196.1 unnamed protein product [Rotaria sp. Silwood2]CAF3383902.1 unnamed protein product [Rotaria sp. Silwood2]